LNTSHRLFFCVIPAVMVSLAATAVAALLNLPYREMGILSFGLTLLFGWGATAPRSGREECFDDLCDCCGQGCGASGFCAECSFEASTYVCKNCCMCGVIECSNTPPCPLCEGKMAKNTATKWGFYCVNNCHLVGVTLSQLAILQLHKKQRTNADPQ